MLGLKLIHVCQESPPYGCYGIIIILRRTRRNNLGVYQSEAQPVENTFDIGGSSKDDISGVVMEGLALEDTHTFGLGHQPKILQPLTYRVRRRQLHAARHVIM